MAEKYPSGHHDRVDSPAYDAIAVTPHDTTKLATYSKALYVGTTGDLTVLTVGGSTVLFAAVPAGTILPIRVQRVNDTGTDAEDIVALI